MSLIILLYYGLVTVCEGMMIKKKNNLRLYRTVMCMRLWRGKGLRCWERGDRHREGLFILIQDLETARLKDLAVASGEGDKS